MNIQGVLIGIIPSIGALAIFFFVVRGIIRADRNERAQIEREQARMDQAAAAAAGESKTSQI